MNRLKNDILSIAYPVTFVDAVIRMKSRNRDLDIRTDVKPLGIVSVLCVQAASEKFKRISESFIILRLFLKLDIPVSLVAVSEELNPLRMYRRGHNVFTRFLMNVGDCILVKELYHWL
jgi:hypothetical protein